MQRYRLYLTMLVLVLVVAVSGCAPAKPAVVPTAAIATKTPKPTFTPTSAVTPTRLIIPTFTTQPTQAPTQAPATATPVPTQVPPTAAPAPVAQFSASQAVNVRQGPSTAYGVIGQLKPGDNYKVTGKNADASWLQFNFNGDPAWVSASLVSPAGEMGTVALAQNIPAPPPPPPTARPVPTQPPAPTSPPAPPKPSYAWALASTGQAAPQCGVPHFSGQVQYASGAAQNGVCVYLGYYGPRTVKFSGGGGAGDGNFSFAPCGAGPCQGPFEIYVIQCPNGVPEAGLGLDPGSPAPAPVSEKFVVNITDKCVTGQWEGIVFKSTQ